MLVENGNRVPAVGCAGMNVYGGFYCSVSTRLSCCRAEFGAGALIPFLATRLPASCSPRDAELPRASGFSTAVSRPRALLWFCISSTRERRGVPSSGWGRHGDFLRRRRRGWGALQQQQQNM